MSKSRSSRGLSLCIAALLAGCGESGRAPTAAPTGAADWQPVVGTRVAHEDAQLGVPSFVWLAPAATPPESTAEGVAWQVLRQLAPLYRLSAEALAAAQVRGVHDTGRGAVLVHFEQRIGETDVFGMELNVALDRRLAPLSVSGHLTPRIRPSDPGVAFSLDEAGAVASATRALLGAPAPGVQRLRTDGHGYTLFSLAPIETPAGVQAAAAPARVRRTYFPRPSGLTPAYYVELDLQKGELPDSDMQSFVISAVDGIVLFRNNLVRDATYRVWADGAPGFLPWDGPHGTALSPYPLGAPDGRSLTYRASQLVTLQNLPFSKNDPWLPTGATQLSGNNAVAYADLRNPDGQGVGDVTVPSTSANTFDYALDLVTTDPAANTTSIRAVTTNLFYVVNYMHDAFYDSGYNEAARNPQQNNLGRGGVAGDPIKAEAQDYSGRNNANASTPADGKSPRIQQYLWDPTRSLTVNSPAGIAGTYITGSAGWGPLTFSVTKNVVVAVDPTTPTSDGCEAPFVNRTAVNGNIALVDRGLCNFAQKVQNALIFCNKKVDVDILYKSLTKHGFSVGALHGGHAGVGVHGGQVDGTIGEESPFHQTHGYYGQGVSLSTAVLPDGWRERLVAFERADAEPAAARCLEIHDIAAAKLVAGREKDYQYVAALMDHRLVDAEVLRLRCTLLPGPRAVQVRVLRWVDRQLS